MKTYIALLRGINVSGQKIIKMADLKRIIENLNFKAVKTYLQSGNVIFSIDEQDPKKLEKNISEAIEAAFGFSVPVLVQDRETLESIVKNNPFAQHDVANLYVIFLTEVPVVYQEEKIREKLQPQEELVITSRMVYLYCPNGYGKTNIHTNFLESKLQVQATTRNWKTVITLLKQATS